MNDTPPPPTPRMRERETVRTARYYLYGAEPAHARRVWFALHGYGMLAARFARPFDAPGVIPDDTCVVVPEGLSRFYLELPRADGGHMQRVGATWLTREARDADISDAHRWLDLVHDEIMHEASAQASPQASPPVVGVIGFSQGVATAMRWVASGRVQPTCFVAWAGSLAQDVDGAAFTHKMQHGEVVLVVGTADHFATDATRAASRDAITAFGLRHRALEFDGGHHLDTPVLTTVLHSALTATPAP